jgi:hypothetical protein
MFFNSRFCYAFMPTSGNAVGENNSGFRQHRLVSLLCGAKRLQGNSDSASPDPPSVMRSADLCHFSSLRTAHAIGVCYVNLRRDTEAGVRRIEERISVVRQVGFGVDHVTTCCGDRGPPRRS